VKEVKQIQKNREKPTLDMGGRGTEISAELDNKRKTGLRGYHEIFSSEFFMTSAFVELVIKAFL
jgi:hypothetical protein